MKENIVKLIAKINQMTAVKQLEGLRESLTIFIDDEIKQYLLDQYINQRIELIKKDLLIKKALEDTTWLASVNLFKLKDVEYQLM